MNKFNVGDTVGVDWDDVIRIVTTKEKFEEFCSCSSSQHSSEYVYVIRGSKITWGLESDYTLIKSAYDPLNAFESFI